MESEYREGFVYIQNHYAGVIAETEDGYTFTYDEAYCESENAQSISLTMPISCKQYASTVLFPFFDGLIPEGWLLQVVNRNWKIDAKDRFGLLLAVCKDCIGDVSIRNGVDA